MKVTKLAFSFLLALLFVLNVNAQKTKFNPEVETKNVNQFLDNFNTLAAKADYKNYFNCFAEDSQFIGTDATEVWQKKEFMIWAKPHFDKNKTWNFKSLKRNIYFSKDGSYAWFDEVLDTQMKICRGSGVLEKIDGQWKLKQYVLSTTIPNDVIDQVTKIKAPIEDILISELKTKN